MARWAGGGGGGFEAFDIGCRDRDVESSQRSCRRDRRRQRIDCSSILSAGVAGQPSLNGPFTRYVCTADQERCQVKSRVLSLPHISTLFGRPGDRRKVSDKRYFRGRTVGESPEFGG